MSQFRSAGQTRKPVVFGLGWVVCNLMVGHAAVAAPAAGVRVVKDLSYKVGGATDYEKERCKLDLYLPTEHRDFPTIVWFHGGGLQSGDKAGDIAESFGQHFAARGIAVASVNYRLHPMAHYPAYIEDAAAAVAFVHREIVRYGGSSKRVFVSGHSAGGYLTAMVGIDGKYLAQHDLSSGDIAGFMPVAGQMITHSTVREERGISPRQPVIDEAAPDYHVRADAPPFLNIVGSHDLPARAEENRYFVAAMKAAGHKDVTYLEVEGRDHGSVASRIGEPGDAVAKAMTLFIQRLSP
jgi:acetyl esterase/lipase